MVFHGKTDANRLISEIFKRPALWHQRHPSYHNRQFTDRIWMEIATIMKHPKQVLKVKWKGLRDTFRGELRKQEFYEKTKIKRPMWTHYESLQFLTDQMMPKPPIWERKRSRNRRKNSKTGSDNSRTANGNISTCDGTDLDSVEQAIENEDNNSHEKKDLTELHFEACDVLEVVDLLSGGIGLIDGNANNQTDSNPLQIDLPSSPVLASTTHHRKKSRSPLPKPEKRQKKQQPQQQRQQTREKRKIHEVSDDMKEEIVANYEVIELNSVEETLEDNEPIIQSTSPERILVEETVDACEHATPAVDPLESGNRCDDNYYFFMSLLPHIRSLPADRRMLLRMQMQNLVYQEVYRKKDSAEPPSLRPTNND